MRAISLWQPWASAMAARLKFNETRSWSTKYRGLLVIHAAKRWTREEIDFFVHHADIASLPTQIPLGQIVAIGNLIDCVPTESIRDSISEREESWGNYSDGRFAWRFESLMALETPVPFKGAQGLFNVPLELLKGYVP